MNRHERRAREAQQRETGALGVTIVIRFNGTLFAEVPFTGGRMMRDILKQTDGMLQSEGMSWDGALGLLVEMIEDFQRKNTATRGAAASVGGLALWVMARHARDPETAKIVQSTIDTGGKLLAEIQADGDEVTLQTNLYVGDRPDRLHS